MTRNVFVSLKTIIIHLKGAYIDDNLTRNLIKMMNLIISVMLLLAAIPLDSVVDASKLPIHESLTEDDCHQVYLKETVYNQDGYLVRPVVLKLIPDWLIDIHLKPRRDTMSSCVANPMKYFKGETSYLLQIGGCGAQWIKICHFHYEVLS